MKRLLFTALMLGPLALAACGQDSAPEPAPEMSSSAASSTSSTSSSTSATSSAQETAESPTSTAAEPASAPAAPFVVECLPGTPGPARWSDGTTGFSQWCWDTQGGAAVGEAEQSAGLPPAEEPVYDTSGEAQMANGCTAGYIDPETCAAHGY